LTPVGSHLAVGAVATVTVVRRNLATALCEWARVQKKVKNGDEVVAVVHGNTLPLAMVNRQVARG